MRITEKEYILIDDKGIPIIEAIRYLKYLDSTGKRVYTQKTYCYALKHFFTYLSEVNIPFQEVSISVLSEFIAWLRNPYNKISVIPIQQKYSQRTEITINLILTVVTNFYDYLYRNQLLNDNVSE